MRFASGPFILFLVLTLAAYWGFAKRRSARVAVLVLAGYVFYASFNPYFVPLLFLVSALDHVLARAMGAGSKGGRRRALVAVSVFVDLGLLAAFKYLDFFGESLAEGLGLLGVEFSFEPLGLPLPVGISFYVFQSLAYTIDVYRGRREPAGSLFDYLAFIAFFPRLIAGPIVRSETFLPQLDERPRIGRRDFGLAIFLLMSGFLKKMAIADYLRENIVDRVFDFPAMYQSAEILAAVFAFTVQIYCDFSGYTDIALGMALLFGLRLPENFAFPYLAGNLRDFWRRWHITLSTWLRDYLYISLGGSRTKPWRLHRNLLITMVLGGLWHGAAWTFVIWGALHGLALSATRFVQRRREKAGVVAAPSAFRKTLNVLFTFLFVSFAWAFFRADDLGTVADMFRQIGTMTWGIPNVSRGVLVAFAFAALGMWFPPRWFEKGRDRFVNAPAPLQIIIAAAVGYVIFRVFASEFAPFVYEKF